MRSFLIIFNLPLVLIVLVQASLADSPENSDEDQITTQATLPEEIVRAKKIYESSLDAFAISETLDLTNLDAIDFSDALERAAGVQVKSAGSLGQPETVSLRAFSDSQTAVMVEGVRVDSISGLSFDLSVLDPLFFEQAEIIKGPSSTLFGSGAMGGAINLKVARPKKSGMALTTKFGSFATAQGSVAVAVNAKRIWNITSLSAMSAEGNYRFLNDNGTEFEDNDDFFDTRDNSWAKRAGGFARGEYEITEKTALNWIALYQKLWRGSPGLVTFPSRHAKSDEHLGLGITELSHIFSQTLASTLRLSCASRGYEFSDPLGEQTGVKVHTTQVELDPSAIALLNWQPTNILLIFTEVEAGKNSLDDSVYGKKSREYFAATFGVELWLFSKILGLSAQARHDEFSDESSATTPKAGVRLIPAKELEFKFSYAQAYRVPSFAELYFNQGFVEGNPELKPEQTHGVDFQTIVRTNFLSASLGAFYQRAQDLIEYTLTSGFRYRPINIGEALIYGAETSAVLNLKPFELSGSYAHTEALDDTDEPNRRGNQLPGRPKDSGYLRIALNFDEFFIYADAHGVAGVYLNAANTKMVDPYLIFGSGAGVKQKNWRIQLDVQNLFDQQAFDIRGMPLTGRAVYLTVGYKGF